MYNYTLLEKYKAAIKAKYEIEMEGDYSYYLKNPSRGKLRDLCWMIFEKKADQEDLNVFCTLLGMPFDLTKKDKFKEQKDKFRPIETFFKGETDPSNIDAINLAAILIDFPLRPFVKFKAKYTGEIKIGSFNEPELSVLKDEQKEKNVCDDDEDINETESSDKVLKPISLFMDFEKKEFPRKTGRTKRNVLIITAGAFCLFFLVYYFVQKNECIQWSDDHYEEVSCDLKIQGIGTYNVVEPFDERIINLRKIQVSDTTTFFKNGEAVIWYAKTNDSVDFFNTHGRHPENKKPLKPVTQYIIDKYVKNK
ncbi:hypothetical protein [Flavobacterium pectinovorum]|uniref:hypothetical protein n=1 Tax=Flavobacterium pectinovorum TaxID=29533 RepID=UPI001FAB4A9A|nr:hypothetical protein [Flavobacterium pectinovorum]